MKDARNIAANLKHAPDEPDVQCRVPPAKNFEKALK
jgi:hypothetical protein